MWWLGSVDRNSRLLANIFSFVRQNLTQLSTGNLDISGIIYNCKEIADIKTRKMKKAEASLHQDI